ncbi:MAG: hypothetical protein HS115_01320 [Spirochaetales bacterium]|nr:hypothetical protein [Spirochaetales bacterium]
MVAVSYSLFFLLLGLLTLGALVALSLQIKKKFEASIDSIDIKAAGLLAFYRQNIGLALSGMRSGVPLLCLLHLATLHSVVPLLGLGIFYRTDLNFLPVVLGLLLSMQIHQRLYPAVDK